MDRWSQLSMSEKSDLMSLYIKNGISSLEEIKKHYNSYVEGGTVDGPDEPNFVGGATSVNPNYQVWEDLAKKYTIEANKPSWQQGLTDYDWARARQYYSDADGNLTNQGIEFLKNVSSKRTTGQSNFMRDVNKLSYIPNAAMLGAGALSGAAFNPYLWSAIGLASGTQNIEDKNYKEAALDLGLTLGIPAARPVAKMINTAVESTKFGKAARTAAEINKAINKTKFTNKEPYLNVGWAPKQDMNVYHASNEPLTIERLRFPDYDNWAVSKGAPADVIYLAEGDKPVSGFLTQRPYLQQWEVSLNKPMVQVGEIPTETKNLTRGKLLRQAQSSGADAMIFDGIADNQMKNQRIVADFTKENLNNRASSMRLNKEYIPTLDQAVQEAEDAYVRNNPLAFVHEIEDMQLLNTIREFNGRRGSPSLGISRFDANGNAYTGYGNVRFYFPKEYIKGLKSYSWSDDALLPTTSDAIREAERRGIKLKYTEDGEALISPELESQLKIELLKDHPHLNKRDKNLETSIKNIRAINSPSHYGEVYPLEPVDLSKALYVQTSETYPTLINWLKLNGIQYGTEVPAIFDKRITFKNGGKLKST